MATKLSKEQQEFVAQTLVYEFGPTLGITIEGAREAVEKGQWDDHPILNNPDMYSRR